MPSHHKLDELFSAIISVGGVLIADDDLTLLEDVLNSR